LHEFWESHRTHYFLSGLLVGVLVVCMEVALLNCLGWLPMGGRLGRRAYFAKNLPPAK
jgi:hypothetical protein